ncbi:MAG: hypothetical protein NTU97_01125, partial [Candidatus Magasanikbacteria bacterium]|nr:hypothetical protein [Candidatus Magasanikbacteria bacterium]
LERTIHIRKVTGSIPVPSTIHKTYMEEELQPSQQIYGEIYHVWQIPEYHQHQRGRTWYIVAGIVFVFLIGYGIFTNNFLFSLLMLLFAGIIFMHSTREPMYLNIGVSDKGVILNERFITYDKIQSFWIIDEPPLTKNLFLKFDSAFSQPLSIHLAEQDAEEVRSTLTKFLEEDVTQKEEPLSDLLWRVLKL